MNLTASLRRVTLSLALALPALLAAPAHGHRATSDRCRCLGQDPRCASISERTGPSAPCACALCDLSLSGAVLPAAPLLVAHSSAPLLAPADPVAPTLQPRALAPPATGPPAS